MNAIFAVDSTGGFGAGNTMPWPRSPVDMKRFKKLTSGHTVLMGANTWNSDIPRPFPNRRNCVLSTKLVDSRCEVFKDVPSFLESVSPNETVFVIGGEKTLWEMKPYINTIYLTVFNDTYQESTVGIDVESYLDGFELISGEYVPGHRFKVYYRI